MVCQQFQTERQFVHANGWLRCLLFGPRTWRGQARQKPKPFYRLLDMHMPDWRAVKVRLDALAELALR